MNKDAQGRWKVGMSNIKSKMRVNIIGVPRDKSASMTGNSGHRIFVPLQKGDEDVGRKVKIFMTGDIDEDHGNGLQCGSSFSVLDANATDDDEATLLVPCDEITAGDPVGDVCFDVYATGLGTPGGSADVDVVCTFDDNCIGCDIEPGPFPGGDTCDTGSIDFSIARGGGKPVTENITNVFRASGCIDFVVDATPCGDDAADIEFKNVWIFNIPALIEYFWDYDNNGLKVMQLRFCDSDTCGT